MHHMQLVLANPGCEAVSTCDWLKAESNVLLHHTYDHVLRKCKHALCLPACRVPRLTTILPPRTRMAMGLRAEDMRGSSASMVVMWGVRMRMRSGGI